LQTQIDALSRKASTAETILENITTERDAAVSQLSVAWCTIEQLKAENEDLKAGNDDLNARMGQMTNHHDNETQRWEAKKEAVQRKHEKKIEAMKVRMGDAGVQSSGLQNEIASFSRFDNNTETQRCDAPQTAELAHKDVNTMFDLSVKQDAANDTTRDRRQHLQIDDSQDSEDSIYEAPKNKGKGRSQTKHSRPTKNAPNDETPKDLTYLSFIDVRFPSSMVVCTTTD